MRLSQVTIVILLLVSVRPRGAIGSNIGNTNATTTSRRLARHTHRRGGNDGGLNCAAGMHLEYAKSGGWPLCRSDSGSGHWGCPEGWARKDKVVCVGPSSEKPARGTTARASTNIPHRLA